MKRSPDAKAASPSSPHEGARTLFYDGSSGSRKKSKSKKGGKGERRDKDGEVKGKPKEEERKRKVEERRSSFPTLPTMRIAQQIEVCVCVCGWVWVCVLSKLHHVLQGYKMELRQYLVSSPVYIIYIYMYVYIRMQLYKSD